MSNSILSLTEEMLSQLKMKHPDNRDSLDDVLLNGPIKMIHRIVFDTVDEKMLLRAASITKGGSGFSGLDVDEANTNLKLSWCSFLRSLQIIS